jgi:hypothetical protein
MNFIGKVLCITTSKLASLNIGYFGALGQKHTCHNDEWNGLSGTKFFSQISITLSGRDLFSFPMILYFPIKNMIRPH